MKKKKLLNLASLAIFKFARFLSHPKKRANSAMRSKKTCLHSLSHNCITASDDTELGPHIDSAHMGVKSFLKLLVVFIWSIFIRAVIDHMTCYNLNWPKIKF